MISTESLLEDLTPPQREAVSYVDGPLLVIAGAGSGKTRVLTRRVGYLASVGIPMSSIVAITFTNKAKPKTGQVQLIIGPVPFSGRRAVNSRAW